MSSKRRLKIDLIIPVFEEEGVVEHTHAKLCEVIDNLPHHFTIYYIDDGSSDGTVTSLTKLAGEDKRINLLEFSRNFGHQAALTAGLDVAQGDFVISMDGDGQHPPEMITQMLDLFQQGYDVIQAQRLEDVSASPFKQFTSSAFYNLINRISGTRIIGMKFLTF